MGGATEKYIPGIHELQNKLNIHDMSCNTAQCSDYPNHLFVNLWSENYSNELYYRINGDLTKTTINIIYSLYLKLFEDENKFFKK